MDTRISLFLLAAVARCFMSSETPGHTMAADSYKVGVDTNSTISAPLQHPIEVAVTGGDHAEPPCEPRPTPTITFTLDANSPLLVNGMNPHLTVTSPLEKTLDTLTATCGSGGCTYTVSFDATLDSFELGATTEGDYPCEPSSQCDTCLWKGGGQHILVIVDNGDARVITDLNSPADLLVPSATSGPHTIRAFLSRSWDESIKNVDSISAKRATRLYAVRTFYVDTNTGTYAVDSTKPLLTPSAPLDTNAFVYHPDSVLLDFYMMFKDLSSGYVVAATIYDSTMYTLANTTLTSWGPYCIGGLEEPASGHLRKYFIRTRLLDSLGDPVTNGPGNFNDRTWAFWVRAR